MSAEKNTTETTNIESSKTETNPSVAISGQYVKDLSFENPNAPMSLAVQKEAHNNEVSLNIQDKGLKKET